MGLRERWMADIESQLEQSIKKRLLSVICGIILGEEKNSGINSAIDRLINTAIYDKNKIKNIDSFDLIKGIAPLVVVFDEEENFNKIKIFLENYLKDANLKKSDKLGIIIFMELMYRLFHYDDYDRALEKTFLASKKYLNTFKYKKYLKQYDCLFKKQKFSSPEQKSSDDLFPFCLSQAYITCLNNDTFEKTISSASLNQTQSDLISVIAGAMAGIYYKTEKMPDITLKNPEIKNNIDILLKEYYNLYLKHNH